MSKYLGSIKITKISESVVKLFAANYNQVETSDSIVINDVQSPEIVIKDIAKYAAESKYIIPTKRKDFYEFKDFQSMIKEIRDFIKGQLIVNKFDFNKTEYEILLFKYKESPTPQLKGKLFELQMSKKYNAFVFSDLPISFVSSFGFTRVDTGIDLVDVENKKLYQCKYTEKKLTMNDKLKRSLLMYEKISHIDSKYKLFLIVNDGADISSTVVLKFTIIREKFIDETIGPYETAKEVIEDKDIETAKEVIEDKDIETAKEVIEDKAHQKYCGETCIGIGFGKIDGEKLSGFRKQTFIVDDKAKSEIIDAIYELGELYDAWMHVQQLFLKEKGIPKAPTIIRGNNIYNLNELICSFETRYEGFHIEGAYSEIYCSNIEKLKAEQKRYPNKSIIRWPHV